jgi:hypothetical protein
VPPLTDAEWRCHTRRFSLNVHSEQARKRTEGRENFVYKAIIAIWGLGTPSRSERRSRGPDSRCFQKPSSPAWTPTQNSAFESCFRELSTVIRPRVSRMAKFLIQVPPKTIIITNGDVNAA